MLPTLLRSLCVVCVLLLSNCAKMPDSHLQVNQELASPYTMLAAAYLAMAKNQTGNEQQATQLMAAGRLIQDGQWRQGQMIASRVHPLSTELADKKQLLLAKIDLIRERPKTAISRLSKVKNSQALGLYYQSQFHEMLAQAYEGTANTTESVSERIKLEHILPDPASKSNNRRALWLALTKLPQVELNTLAMEAEDGQETKGWMELASISRTQYNTPHSMLNAVNEWQAQYSKHPANGIIHLNRVDDALFTQPRQIALLLPLTGPLSGPGNAIRDGFMAARQASHDNIRVRFYNTDSSNVAELYAKAVDEGAQYVVGPLTKSNVAVIAKKPHPVPTLLLNDTSGKIKPNAYQFGLSPSNEARQVASKARRNGYTKALVIAPEGEWGNEVVGAFTAVWQANGGKVVDALRYASNDALNPALKDFLHITQSESRKNELKQILGRKLEATPRRRRDFDMIFLLAYPSKARQIMPLLKYYYAGDVPVYSTSLVYAGHPNAMKDRDLNGIIFCDMPWVFDNHKTHKNWPESFNSYNRLYALGTDSYALSSQLNQLLVFPAMGVQDNSGILYLTPNNQVARIHAWGQFKDGQAIKYRMGLFHKIMS